MKQELLRCACAFGFMGATLLAGADDVAKQPPSSLRGATSNPAPAGGAASTPRDLNRLEPGLSSPGSKPMNVRDSTGEGPNFLGVALYTQSFDPAHPAASTVATPPQTHRGVVSTTIVNAWESYTPSVTKNIVKTIQQPGFVKGGYTIYNARLVLGDVVNSYLQIANPPGISTIPPVGASDPLIVVTTTQSRLDARSTSPYTSKDSDPSFHITFDLTAYIHIGGGIGASELALHSARVVVSNVDFVPDNDSAKLGSAASDLAAVFGGKGFPDQLKSAIQNSGQDIGSIVRPALVGALAAAVPASPANGPKYVIAGIFADTQNLNVVLAPRVTPDAQGRISGTLAVNDLGRPTPNAKAAPGNGCANAFAMDVSVPVQPPYVASLKPFRLAGQTPQMQSIGSQLQYSWGFIRPGNGVWTCDYQIKGLASNSLSTIAFRQPGSVAGQSVAGRFLVVSFKTCANSEKMNKELCSRAGDVCSSPLLVPAAGGTANCALTGTFAIVAAGSAGAQPRSNVVSGATNPGGPVEQPAQGSPSWGTSTPAAAPGAGAAAPNWGTPAASSTRSAPSSVNARGAATTATPQTPSSLGNNTRP